jgi:dienelactone hydrolase
MNPPAFTYAFLTGSKMQGQVLVCHGGSDPFVTADMMSEFQQDVQERNGDVTIHTYSDAMHAFTRPEKTLEGYVCDTLQPPRCCLESRV